MKWILGIGVGWFLLGLVVVRWVGGALGPKSPEEQARDDRDQARALGLDVKPDRDDGAAIEEADLVEAALEDFYGDPFPGAGPRSERRTLGRQGRLSPTSRRVG